jgi:hypothetical protein
VYNEKGGQEAHMGKIKMHAKFWSVNLKGRDRLRDLGVDETIIL